MIQGVVDRIEENCIVLNVSSGKILINPKSLFPDLREGDVISISITKDEIGQKEIEDRISDIRKNLKRVEL